MVDPGVVMEAARRIWEMIPEHLRDWSRSEVLNFIKTKAPKVFQFCANKISAFWAKVTNKEARNAVDTVTSNYLSLNDRISLDAKRNLFEQITGSEYRPDFNVNARELTEIVHTDEEKKAAVMQMAYLAAVFGEINQKQEAMITEYMTSLRITEELRRDIEGELREAEKEFAIFVKELSRLDEEFKRTSGIMEKAKQGANDIIDLI